MASAREKGTKMINLSIITFIIIESVRSVYVMLLKNNTLIKRDEMVTFKITPDFRVSNTKNEIITSAITNIYKAPSSRISLVEYQL